MNNESRDFLSLGALWSGHEAPTNLDQRRTVLLVPEHINENDMKCGGRQELDRKLTQERGSLRKFCGECVVRQECVFGLAVNHC